MKHVTLTFPDQKTQTSEEKKMWEAMNFCNGELRVMPGRYGGGWLAAGCAVVEWDFDEEWQDLVGGDNDYFTARDYFNQHRGLVLIENAPTPKDAFELCVAKLVETCKRRDVV